MVTESALPTQAALVTESGPVADATERALVTQRAPIEGAATNGPSNSVPGLTLDLVGLSNTVRVKGSLLGFVMPSETDIRVDL